MVDVPWMFLKETYSATIKFLRKLGKPTVFCMFSTLLDRGQSLNSDKFSKYLF